MADGKAVMVFDDGVHSATPEDARREMDKLYFTPMSLELARMQINARIMANSRWWEWRRRRALATESFMLGVSIRSRLTSVCYGWKTSEEHHR